MTGVAVTAALSHAGDVPPGEKYSSDVTIGTPLVRAPGVKPVVEDRTYLGYVASALVLALAGGFLLAVLLPLAITGTIPWETRVPQLTQAHGWAQLQGWAGLFVAGMAMRLIPRFAGRPPVPGNVTLPVLALLVSGIVIRTVAQPAITGTTGDVLMVISGVLGALGMVAVAAVLAVTLAKGRKRPEPWRYFAWAGAAWWAAWAVLTVVAAVRAVDHNRFTPVLFDDAVTWIVIFGAVGNFVWGVQSRSVPVFFGRKTPTLRRAMAPGVALNVGAVLILASTFGFGDAASARLEGAGLVLAGLASAALAPIAGSVWGVAHRLRPRSRAASRYVLAANVTTLLAGLLVAWAGAASVLSGEFEAYGLRDAARHGFGLGMITMLIFGMAQLVAPIFALDRAEARRPRISDVAPFWLLVAAVVLRMGAGLAYDAADAVPRMHTAALAGIFAWVAIALFASNVLRARLAEQRNKRLLGFDKPAGEHGTSPPKQG